MNFKTAFLAVAAIATIFPASVVAVNAPEFPSCNTPQGSIIANYASGTHGIPGQSELASGSDIVFNVDSTRVLQCFCPPSGNGIQSNWWKISEMSGSEINYFKNLGWILVVDGSAWGLDAAAYLVKNVSYNCGSVTPTPSPTTPPTSPTPTPTGHPQPCNGCGDKQVPVCVAKKPTTPTLKSVVRNGSTATVTWNAATPVTHYAISYGVSQDNMIYGAPNVGNVTSYEVKALNPNVKYYFRVIAINDCMPSDASTTEKVLGASTSVLGLASTGTMLDIVILASLGIAGLALSLLVKTKNRAH